MRYGPEPDYGQVQVLLEGDDAWKWAACSAETSTLHASIHRPFQRLDGPGMAELVVLRLAECMSLRGEPRIVAWRVVKDHPDTLQG